jgi:hypothetical protein
MARYVFAATLFNAVACGKCWIEFLYSADLWLHLLQQSCVAFLKARSNASSRPSETG